MKNMKKKILTVVSSMFAISLVAGGVLAQTDAKAEGFVADTQYLEMQMDGASIRLDYDENGNPTGNTGIRFTAVAKPAILTVDGVTEVGVMIAPAKVFDIFEAQKTAENGTTDYFEFFESKGVTKESISYSVTKSELSESEDTNVRVSIVNLDNYDFNVKYQAVGYYQMGGNYYYTQESQVRSVAEVANNALLATDFTGVEERAAAVSVVKKAITVAQGETVNLATYKAKDFAETINAIGIDNAEGFEFSMDTNTAFAIEGSTVTAKSTSATTVVNVKAYNGELDYDFDVKAKAERSEEVTIHANSKTRYTSYGATVESMETNAQFTNLPAINNVVLAAGTLTATDGDIAKVSATNLSYVSFTRNDQYAGVAATNAISTYVAVVEFTGNNMPSIGYYVDNHSETSPMENVINQKGILMTGGFDGFNPEKNKTVIEGFQSRLKIAGYNMLANDFGATTAPNNGGSHLYGATNFAGSYSALQAASQTQRYRLFVCLTAYLKSGTAGTDGAQYATTVQVALYTIDEDNTNGEELCNISVNRGYAWDKDNFKGNIVFYGRPNEETKLDKIHFAQSTGGVSKSVAKFA